MLKIAINGFGRIGRSVLRAVYESGYRNKLVVIAINEIAGLKEMAHLLKYDSTHGLFKLNVNLDQDQLIVEDDSIQIFHNSDIKKLFWSNLNFDYVLDCTGVYGSKLDGSLYLSNGVKKVLYSNLGKSDLDATIIYGVNQMSLKKTDLLVSNGSCTTNCIIPVIKILDDILKIESGTITVIHSAMNDQSVVDSYCENLRLTRSALQSIVPVETKLSYGIERVLPKFKNCFKSISLRVPIVNVTAIDLTINVKTEVEVSQVNEILKFSSKNKFYGILDYNDLPLVSIDFNHNSSSVIIDGTQTNVSKGHLIKILAWCDNEWGFAHRMLDTALAMYFC